MESVSMLLIVIGAGIIGVVLLLRWGLQRGAIRIGTGTPSLESGTRAGETEFDPLFAVDAKVSDVSDQALASVGKILVEREESLAQEESRDSPPPAAPPSDLGELEQSVGARATPPPSRRPPRVAEDPHHVVVLNVMAGGDRLFSGSLVRNALTATGFEFGDWQIFHYYSPMQYAAPPLFSLANMIKPGSFDLENMDSMNTAGLSLFMVPAGVEEDIVTFDTMLAKARQLAEELGGEVRDARRSVLTRQAIGQIREQLNEWRCKAQAALH